MQKTKAVAAIYRQPTSYWEQFSLRVIFWYFIATCEHVDMHAWSVFRNAAIFGFSAANQKFWSTCMHPTRRAPPPCIPPDAPPACAFQNCAEHCQGSLRPLLPRAATGRQPGAVERKISRIIGIPIVCNVYIYICIMHVLIQMYLYTHAHSLYICMQKRVWKNLGQVSKHVYIFI